MAFKTLSLHTLVACLAMTMLSLRLSIFALACLSFYGYQENYISITALALGALSLYAYAQSKNILLAYCHIAAGVVWAASALSFLFTGAPFYLVIILAILSILDGFYSPVLKAINRGLA